jgi:hypothetical protein
MRFAPLRAAAALVAVPQALAFLLPPEISAADTDIIKTLPFEDAVAIDGRVMEINCPGCPVVTNIEGKMHSAQVDSILQLNFTVSHDALDRLFLNGLQIYPIDPRADTFMEPLTASQMVKASDNTWQYVSTPKLGYSLSVRHPVSFSKQDQLDLVAIHLEIVEVADKFLNGMPSIDLKLLETPSGKLMIGDAQISPPKSPANKPTDDGQECTTIICKWRAIVADKLSKLKGCGSKSRPEGAHIVSSPKAAHGKQHDGHNEHSHPHRPYRHHHRHGGFAKFLRRIVLHVFIPVLIGIMVGITASLIGMVVGHIAIFVWRLLFRRGQQARYTRVQQDDAVIEESNDESKGFLDHQGPPPVYAEPPVYTEALD